MRDRLQKNIRMHHQELDVMPAPPNTVRIEPTIISGCHYYKFIRNILIF